MGWGVGRWILYSTVWFNNICWSEVGAGGVGEVADLFSPASRSVLRLSGVASGPDPRLYHNFDTGPEQSQQSLVPSAKAKTRKHTMGHQQYWANLLFGINSNAQKTQPTVSWGTTPIEPRRESWVTLRISCPPTRTAPVAGS